MTPAIAIITRTKNRPQLLERALRSILAQSLSDWIWVVVNAGEAAPVEALFTKYAGALKGRARLHQIPPDTTISAASNHGIRASDSRLVTLLDDDDTWEPDFLESMLGALDERPNDATAGVACHALCVEEEPDEHGNLKPTKEYLQNPQLRNLSLGLMAVMNQFCVHAFVYERRAFDLLGGYTETLPVLDDWEFNLRFLRRFDILFLPRPLARYHLRPAVSQGDGANSQYAAQPLHLHFEAHIINEALRADAEGRGQGLGLLLAQGAAQRQILQGMRSAGRRLESISKKVGSIDSRTKTLKDHVLRKS